MNKYIGLIFLLFLQVNISQANVQVQSMDLDISIFPEKKCISAKAKIHLYNTSKAKASAFLFLDLARFTITKIENEKGEQLSQKNLIFSNILPGKHIFTVHYKTNGAKHKLNVIRKNLVELWDFTQWHPTLMGIKTINYTAKISFPEEIKLVPVSCGKLIKREKKNGMNIYHWKAKNVRNGLSLFAAPYTITQKKYGNMNFTVYTLKENGKYAHAFIEFIQEIVHFLDLKKA